MIYWKIPIRETFPSTCTFADVKVFSYLNTDFLEQSVLTLKTIVNEVCLRSFCALFSKMLQYEWYSSGIHVSEDSKNCRNWKINDVINCLHDVTV